MQLDMFNMFRFQRSVWVWSATSLGVSAKRNIIQIYLLIRVGKVQWRWAVQYAWSHHEKAPAIYVQWEKSKSIPVSGVPLREFGLWRIWRSVKVEVYQLLVTNSSTPPPSTVHYPTGGGDLGSVGDFAAGSEMAFCTLLQRSYAVLGGRMHLGSSTGAGWEWVSG